MEHLGPRWEQVLDAVVISLTMSWTEENDNIYTLVRLLSKVLLW